ncbi:MAG: signal recognition particle-docking protein FtsY [Pirellulaceae bacterium]
MALWKRKKNKSPDSDADSDSALEDQIPEDDSNGDDPPRGDGPVAVAEREPEPEQKKGLFGRFRKAVKKTVDVLNTDVRDLFREEGELVDDEFLKRLFALMVKTDMGAGPAGSIRDAVGKKYRARKMTIHQLAEAAVEVIVEIMEQESSDLQMATSGPTVVMVVGVNGSGKTTSIAKLTHLFREQGKSVVLGAGDTFRAAAVEQLTIWADRLGAEIVTGKQGGDPATVAYRAVDRARETNADVCIVDTAGRLQTQKNLMDQLTKIRNVMKKVIPDSPHEVLLVLDATAGQNAISQARGFSDAAGCTGIVLAKLDGTAKGGVAIPIRQEFGLPVKFIGLGETPDAIAQFDVEQYVHALFDLDDKQ